MPSSYIYKRHDNAIKMTNSQLWTFFFTYADKVHIKNDESNAIPTHQLYVERCLSFGWIQSQFRVNSNECLQTFVVLTMPNHHFTLSVIV